MGDETSNDFFDSVEDGIDFVLDVFFDGVVKFEKVGIFLVGNPFVEGLEDFRLGHFRISEKGFEFRDLVGAQGGEEGIEDETDFREEESEKIHDIPNNSIETIFEGKNLEDGKKVAFTAKKRISDSATTEEVANNWKITDDWDGCCRDSNGED